MTTGRTLATATDRISAALPPAVVTVNRAEYGPSIAGVNVNVETVPAVLTWPAITSPFGSVTCQATGAVSAGPGSRYVPVRVTGDPSWGEPDAVTATLCGTRLRTRSLASVVLLALSPPPSVTVSRTQ